AHAVLPSMGVLYMLYRYGWDERMVGFVLAGVGVCSMIVQGGLIGPVVKRFGERRTLLAGLVFGVGGFLLFGLAQTGTIFLLAIPFTALWGFANAAALGLMSRHVGADEQGQLQGANQSLQGIANMIGPALFAFSFALAIRPELSVKLPGTPFVIAAFLVVGALVVGWRATGGGVNVPSPPYVN